MLNSQDINMSSEQNESSPTMPASPSSSEVITQLNPADTGASSTGKDAAQDIHNGSPKDVSHIAPPSPPTDEEVPSVSFKCIYSGKKYDVDLPITHTIKQLKEHLAAIIGVVPAMQKIMIKGLAGDDKTLQELNVSKTSKVLVVGSKFEEVINVNSRGRDAGASSSQDSGGGAAAATADGGLAANKLHTKVLEKGPPEDVQPGVKGRKDALPPHPISGMVTRGGGKVRLTFKLELDQIWIGTKQRTEKVNMNSIRAVVSEPIKGHEEYHIMALQLGPTEASRYWLYWVPAQYVHAIRTTILGLQMW